MTHPHEPEEEPDCNHHEEVEGDCSPDNDRISAEGV